MRLLLSAVFIMTLAGLLLPVQPAHAATAEKIVLHGGIPFCVPKSMRTAFSVSAGTGNVADWRNAFYMSALGSVPRRDRVAVQ